jgi:hypothetical protein
MEPVGLLAQGLLDLLMTWEQRSPEARCPSRVGRSLCLIERSSRSSAQCLRDRVGRSGEWAAAFVLSS